MTQLPTIRGSVVKYRITLAGGGGTWVLYAHHTSITEAKNPFRLQVVENTRLEAYGSFTGLVQVAFLAKGLESDSGREAALDVATGSYCTGVSISAQIVGDIGKYQMKFERGGPGNSGLVILTMNVLSGSTRLTPQVDVCFATSPQVI